MERLDTKSSKYCNQKQINIQKNYTLKSRKALTTKKVELIFHCLVDKDKK